MTEQQPTTSTHSVTAISLKLPEFWPSDPQLWFAQAEALFDAQGITTEKTKFGHVVRVLPAQYASEVRDIILSPPESPYTAIKEGLQRRVCPSRRQQLQQLLHLEELGDRKPSQLLRHMLKLRGGNVTEADHDELFRQIFMEKMPPAIRMALAIHNKESLSNLAEMADTMAELQGPQSQGLGPTQIYAVEREKNLELLEIKKELGNIWKELKSQRQQAVQEKQAGGTPNTCWYHERFGKKATKCREPCQFKHSEN